MYEQVFGLKHRPFTSTPFVQNYFPGDSIHHALAQIRMSVERGVGPSIITGGAGTGKTLLLAMLNECFMASHRVVNVVCAHMTDRRDLLQAVLFELEQPYTKLTEGELRLSLIDFLRTNSVELLLLVDEAHSLDSSILDELRLLTNFTREGQPVVSLVMAGLPTLEDHLIETKSESLNQRIASRCYLTNLSRSETFEYIVTHLDRAGGNGETMFTGEAIDAIFEYSDGCPRIINQVCDYGLVLAASHESLRVSVEIAKQAWQEVQCIPVPNKPLDTLSPLESDSIVLEFGSLETDEKDFDFAELDQAESLLEESECDVQDDPAVAESSDFEYTLQSLEDENEGKTSVVESAEVADFDFSITDDNLQDDRFHNFDNPFEERFEEEETVFASFIPAVSQQNISSLMITSEQLCLLENIPSRENFDVVDLESNLPAEQSMGVSVTTDEMDLSKYSDLRMTPDALEGLQQVEDDVRKLQRDILFDEREFSSIPVHSDLEFCDSRHVCDNSSSTEQEPNSVVDAKQNAETTDVSLTTIQFENGASVERDVDCQDDSCDDRDIMIISRPERFSIENNESELAMEGQYEGYISTGNAQRMDYRELFQQLKNAT